MDPESPWTLVGSLVGKPRCAPMHQWLDQSQGLHQLLGHKVCCLSELQVVAASTGDAEGSSKGG